MATTNTTKQDETQSVNSTASMKGKAVSDAELSKDVEKAKKAFEKDKLVKTSIPAVLQAKLGANLFVGVNGVSITVPVDGEEYEVPETFANHIKQTLKDLK